MRLSRPAGRSIRFASAGAALSILAVSGCAPVLGVPRDPENPDLLQRSAILTALEASFDPSEDSAYDNTPCGPADCDTLRSAKRNEIVLRRVRTLNLEFSNFEERLYGDSNVVGSGGDLLLLILGGLGATTGNAATKAALAAASAGIVGAQAAINKDLFFQRTIPALMAQMEANRATATARILDGLAHSDREYPLIRAEIDLDTLKRAGSIPSAISGITSQASIKRDAAVASQAAAADAAFVAMRGPRRTLSDRAGSLGVSQAIALANREIPTLALLSDDRIRTQIAATVPRSGHFESAAQARTFLQLLFQAGRSDDALLARWSADLDHAEGP